MVHAAFVAVVRQVQRLRQAGVHEGDVQAFEVVLDVQRPM